MKQVLSACVLLVGFAIAGAGGAVAHAQEAHAADEGASFKALNDEFMLAIKNFYGKLEELEKAGEDTASYERESHPRLSFIERFEAGAKQHAGSEEAVPYLVWLVQFGGGSEQAGLSRSDGSALDTLKSPLVRRFGQARRLTAPPCVLVLDGPRSPQSSTAIRMALEPRLMA